MSSGAVLVQTVLESASESVHLKASKKENEWESPFTEVSIAVWLLFFDCYLFGEFCEHLK